MKTIEDILDSMPKSLKDAYRRGNEIHTEILPVASISLTQALGGGIGKGRMTLIYGSTSAGKSLLMLSTIAKLQREDPEFTAAWIDTEASFTDEWARRVGVDTERLIVVQRIGANHVTDAAVPLIEAGIDMLVVDSISQIIPAAFLEDDGVIKEFERTKQIGAHSKSITMMVNAFNYANKNTAVVLLSQTTTNLSGLYATQDPHGGQKTQFAASQIIKLTSSNVEAKHIKGQMKIGDRIIESLIGRKVEALVTKNKLAKPMERATYDLYYAGDFIGIDHYGELVDEAIKVGVIVKGGAWLKYGDQNIQGRDKFIDLVKNDAVLYEEIKKEVESA